MRDTLTVGSLFTGIGGIDLAMERAGMRVAWQVEIDKDCTRVLSRQWPDTQRFGDICNVGAHNLAPVDVLVGGFPCQDLSVAGRRAGLRGSRSGLFFEFTRIARELEPAFLVIENVPGLLSSHAGADFALVLRELVECGARDVAWRVLDAQHFGVPQRRRRVFLVADFRGERAGQILFESEGVSGHPPQSGEAGQGTARGATVSTLQGGGRRGQRIDAESAAGGHQVPAPISEVRAAANTRRGWWTESDQGATLSARDYKDAENTVVYPAVCVTGEITHALTSEGADASEDGSGRGAPVVAIQDAAMPRSNAENGIGITEDGPMYTLDGHGAHAVAVDLQNTRIGGDLAGTLDTTRPTRGELRTSSVAPSLNVGGGKPGEGYSAALVGYGVRRLTPREAERLQGYEDDWTAVDAEGKTISDSSRYRLLGNSVAVPVVEWIARRLADAVKRQGAAE